ncbi:MAG: methylase [endosymbiont of Galathealinum brachiosum]|uniref:Methylase n=1 Tax=endosymbiont of Galathealinum brachiosum TaxID=2200906 RepID=A0A370DLB3_9GAMM|nr:MAG: methylase [endosymbiont of Galathealinum brachiosum]
MMNKPNAPSCEQNQQVILDVLKTLFIEPGDVLEIGSGTGQHAVFFTEYLPHLIWQPGDLEAEHAGMKMWLDEVIHNRIKQPLVLDVDMPFWSVDKKDYIFTANTTHIISLAQAEKMLSHVGKYLKQGGLFAQYGPFNYNGNYTSESNANFDVWLKQRNPYSCIKDFETIESFANQNGMKLLKDIEMPANNRILVWQKNS